MNRIRARHLSIIIAIAMLFTSAYFMMGQDTYAVSKPKAPKTVNVKNIRTTTATVSWTKVKRNVRGYTIYRNGKAIKSVGPNVLKYKDKALKPATKNTYKIKAYNIAKKKQWYNKKTGKWQAKKPAKKYRGKSRTVKTRVYGKASVTVSFKTQNNTWKIYGRTIKASQCPITFTVKSSKCPNCNKYGQKATVTYKNEHWKAVLNGTDYSKKCHHCKGISLKGWCIRYKSNGDVKRTWYFTNDGRLNTKNGTVDPSCKYGDHKYEGEDCTDLETGKGDNVQHFNAKNKWVYCFECNGRFKKK